MENFNCSTDYLIYFLINIINNILLTSWIQKTQKNLLKYSFYIHTSNLSELFDLVLYKPCILQNVEECADMLTTA